MASLNAFSTLTIHGLVRRNNENTPQTFQRGSSRPGGVWQVIGDSLRRPGGFPQRPPSNLPPPGNEHISIELEETIGKGRVGTVHEVNLLTHQTAGLPPLVVKISRHKRTQNMEKEAWFYGELEKVQGIAVPRCYGFFQAHVEEGAEVLTWNDKQHVQPRRMDEYGFPVVELETQAEDPTLLSILLLECLGWNIPVGYDDFDYDTVRDDVYEVYNDLAILGIEHVDFRWSNILSVILDSEGGFSGPVCPNHGHAHQWRIVDFDLARKSDCIVEGLQEVYISHLSRLFNNLPKGRIIEPWH